MYFFNKSEELVQVANNFIEAHLVEQINTASQLTFSLKKPLSSEVRKACIPSPNRDGFLMFKILTEDIKESTIEYTCIESAYDELASYGYIKDLRPSARQARYMLEMVLQDTRWELGLIYNTSNATTNFYYEPVLNCIQDIVSLFSLELTFTVSIEGNKITTRQVNMYYQQGNRTGKRFEYGSNALDVERETSTDELYTALVGRGKGEQVDGDNDPNTPDGYGRRITFADVEWKKSAGNPLDKPKGQEYLEDPDATKTYGFDNGKPRIGLVEFEDDTDKKVLLQHTYQKLQELKRPKVQFKASVIDVGDCTLGDTVAIIRHDFHLEYMTRVFKVDHDLLDEHNNTVELGDDLSSQDITNRINDISNTLNQNAQQISYVMTSADGQHKVNYSPDQPANAKNGDLWYKDLGNGETELYIYNDGWQLVVSTEHQKEIDDAIEQAKTDTKAAKELAQSGVDKANIADGKAQKGIDDAAKALSDTNVVNQQIIKLKGGSTATLAELESGLKSTVKSQDFETYRGQTDKLIQDRVTSAEFTSYRSQTDQAIQDRITSTKFDAKVNLLDSQLTSVITDLSTQNYNLIKNGSFIDNYANWYHSAGLPITRSLNNGAQPFTTPYVRVRSPSGNYQLAQTIVDPARISDKDWNLNFYFRGDQTADASGYLEVYLKVTHSDGSISYPGHSGSSLDLSKSGQWQRVNFSLTKNDLADVSSAVLVFGFSKANSGNWYLSQIQVNPGENAQPYTESTDNFATSSQITQLSGQINARVQIGDLINQINISKEGILIDGAKTHITNETTIDKAVITSAMIKEIKADLITTGELNGANLHVINIDVSAIVGDTSNFVKSAWNGVSQYVNIDSNGINIGGGTGNLKLTRIGLDFVDVNNGENVAEMHTTARKKNPKVNGVMIGLNVAGDYFSVANRTDDNDPESFKSLMEWMDWNTAGLNSEAAGWHFYDTISLHGNYLQLGDKTAANGAKLQFGLHGFNGTSYPALMNYSGQTGILFGGNNVYIITNGESHSMQTLFDHFS